MFGRRVRSALLVDFDNVVAKTGIRMVENVRNWLDWLEDGGFDPARRRRQFLAKRVYWFTDSDRHRHHFLKQGFHVTVCRAVRNKEKASSADFDLTIDAVELRHQFPNIEEFVLLAFDGDFLTLLNHLQLQDLEVAGMAAGTDRPAKAYRQFADYVIEKEAFEQAFAYTRPPRRLFGLLPGKRAPMLQPPRPAAAVAPPAPKQEGKRKRRAGTPRFDLEGAARVAAEAAAQAPSSFLSKRFVSQALAKFEGFSTVAPNPWLGCGTYPAMIEKFAQLNPSLQVERQQNGALVLVCKGPATAEPTR